MDDEKVVRMLLLMEEYAKDYGQDMSGVTTRVRDLVEDAAESLDVPTPETINNLPHLRHFFGVRW